MKIQAAVLALISPLLSFSNEIPESVIPAGVGVNIHFVTGHEKDLDLIAAAGFKWVRMDFQWETIERNKGEYDWSSYDELMSNLDKRGIRALFILDYSHSLYEKVVTSPHPITGQPHEALASPQHEESIAAFARWAAASAKHFHGRHIIWEIWNEPNIQFWSPKPDATQYTQLALATCKAIRAAEPTATIVAPASSGFPWEFFETVLKSGTLKYLDAVTVHPYRDKSKPPETAVTDYDKLRQMIDRYAPDSKKGHIPVLSGEWGYSSHQIGVSQDVQAAFAARQQLSNLLNGIPLSIWYDWKNDGEDAKENEHNFGTVSYDLKPKPAYAAIQKLTHELDGYRIARRVSLQSQNDYALICTNTSGLQKLVAWTTTENHTCQIPLRSRDAQPPSDNKKRIPYSPLNFENLGVELKSEPQYIPLKGIFRN